MTLNARPRSDSAIVVPWCARRWRPEKSALVGYDDIPAAEYADPPLTTIRQPMCEVGKLAARLLIQRIEDEDQTDEVVLLEPELVRRET